MLLPLQLHTLFSAGAGNYMAREGETNYEKDSMRHQFHRFLDRARTASQQDTTEIGGGREN